VVRATSSARVPIRRQAAHFFRDDREAPAMLAGARGFDGGVQRQQIGLRRELLDEIDEVVDRRALLPRAA